MLIRTRMTRAVITAPPSMTLGEALALMQAKRFRHLPIVEGERLVGLVTDRDLRLASPPPGALSPVEANRVMERRVADVMVSELITASPEMPVEEAARLMHQHRIGCLPVTVGDHLVGILTASDLLRAFVELFGVNRPSSRIEVRMANRPGELARVVRAIGIDAHINITGLVIPPLGREEAVAVIHLQTLDPRDVIGALQRMGYEVGWPSLELESGAEVVAGTGRPRPAAPRPIDSGYVD